MSINHKPISLTKISEFKYEKHEHCPDCGDTIIKKLVKKGKNTQCDIWKIKCINCPYETRIENSKDIMIRNGSCDKRYGILDACNYNETFERIENMTNGKGHKKHQD